MQALCLKNVSYRAGPRWLLQQISLTLPVGGRLWLEGANGAGKTTLLRLCATSLRPHLGEVQLFGQSTQGTRLTALRRRLVLASHAHHFFESLTGAQNLGLVAALAGIHERARCADALLHVGLEQAGGRPVGGYSAGMKRRLTLARAWLLMPELVLLDEPFAQLDAEGIGMVARLLERFAAAGATVVVVSHQAHSLGPWATHTATLRGGRLCEPAEHRAALAGAAVLKAPARTPPSAWSQWGTLVRKELQLERTLGLRLGSLVPFAAVVLLLFALSVGPEPRLLERLSAAFCWLALTFGSTLGLSAAQAAEDAHDAGEGQRLLGISGVAAFAAKAGVNALLLVALAALMAPVAVALFGMQPRGPLMPLAGVVGLGALAIALPGTLLAVVARRAQGHDILLPLLLFPILIPGLLAATRATSLLVLGDPMDEGTGWVGLLAGFDMVYGLLGAALFAQALET